MSLISIVSFIIFFLLIASSFKRGTDLFSPSKVFGIVWSLTIGLTELKLSRLQHEWNSYEWLMLSIGIISFFLGSFVVYAINFQKRIIPLNEIRSFFTSNTVDKKKFRNIILILFLIYIFSFFGNYIIEGYLPAFHFMSGQSRMFWGVFGIGLTVHIATPLIIFIVAYIRMINPKRAIKYLLISIIVITFLTYMTLLQRFNMIFAIVAVITMLYYLSNFLKFKNIFILFIIFIGLMYSVQFLRISSFALEFMYSVAQMKFDFKYAILTEPYMYFVMNLENFVRAVNHLENHSFGYYTFHFLLSLTGIKRAAMEYFSFNDFPFLNSSYNTYSMFWDYYRDFGVFGLSFIPFALGLLSSTIYYKMRREPSFIFICSYSIIIFLISISFFVNVIGLLHFVFNTVLIISVGKIIQRKYSLL